MPVPGDLTKFFFLQVNFFSSGVKFSGDFIVNVYFKTTIITTQMSSNFMSLFTVYVLGPSLCGAITEQIEITQLYRVEIMKLAISQSNRS